MSEKKIYLTSGEIASLWTGYMNDSMSKCVLGYMLKHIEDPDIKPVIQLSYDISSKHLELLVSIFEKNDTPFQMVLTNKTLTLMLHGFLQMRFV